MTRFRGRDIGMVFQEPMASLDPVMPIGRQVAETARAHTKIAWSKAMDKADAMLTRVGLDPETAPRDRYPHQLSGGQCQRVALAAALVMTPRLLIADEPTTALDVTTQAEIVLLLRQLVHETGMALLLISHDLALVSGLADVLVVMRAGRVVEAGPTQELIANPREPYTRSLIAAARTTPPETPAARAVDAVLVARGLVLGYGRRTAVAGVDISIGRGERVALVGESGSGKSSLMRALLGLARPDAGDVCIAGISLVTARGATLRTLRRNIQAVFQDSVGSFDPRWTAELIVTEPLALLDQPPARRERAAALMQLVGLSAADLDRLPHQFSGGQRQRLAIARALAVDPPVIVLDEATSALDAAIKVEILTLVRHLAEERGTACLLITHDLSAVARFAERVLVMQAGRIVEEGSTEQILTAPREAYTARLVASIPVLQPAARAT